MLKIIVTNIGGIFDLIVVFISFTSFAIEDYAIKMKIKIATTSDYVVTLFIFIK